jgi:hypothetical protein
MEFGHPAHQRRIVVTLDGIEGRHAREVGRPQRELLAKGGSGDNKIGRGQVCGIDKENSYLLNVLSV